MNFYVSKNAETLQDFFVAHKGQETIDFERNDWFEVVEAFRSELQGKIKTPWMAEWISPGFSTSTLVDEQTATVLMMGLMKTFSRFEGGIVCGIPSITLMGTQEDWRRLLSKINRLADFGSEPKAYADRMRPLLARFVSLFDDPASEATKAFWEQIVQARVLHSNLCGAPPTQYLVSGWILGFFYWDAVGCVSPRFSQGTDMWQERESHSLEYDGVRYGTVPLDDMPLGYAKAKFKFNTDIANDLCNDWILAGNVGKCITDGAPEAYQSPKSSLLRAMTLLETMEHPPEVNTALVDEGEKDDEKRAAISPEMQIVRNQGSTIQPASGWFLFCPEKDPGPCYDEEETYGPTVDAINASDSVEHVQLR